MSEQKVRRSALFRYAMFGSAIAFAGPPIYIHAPRFYADVHALDLAVIGAVLLAVRAIDFIQDPLLGVFVERYPDRRRELALLFSAVLGLGVAMLFAPEAPIAAHWQLALASVVVFTGFSGLQILYYSTGVGLGRANNGDHAHVAAWREAGILMGVCAASAAPTLISADPRISYSIYSAVFVVYLAIAFVLMRNVWPLGAAAPSTQSGFLSLLKDERLRRIFLIGLLNTLPVGITSTLFLFYVGDRLAAPELAGVLLLVFFLCAGISAPLWARLAKRVGMRPALMIGMALSIVTFAFAIPLSEGDALKFAIVSAASGAAIGADLTLMPAILSSRLQAMGAGAGRAFGLWGFLTKASLALAAGLVLPALAAAGYEPGAVNENAALRTLALAYAGIPCLLKTLALIAVYFSHNLDDRK